MGQLSRQSAFSARQLEGKTLEVARLRDDGVLQTMLARATDGDCVFKGALGHQELVAEPAKGGNAGWWLATLDHVKVAE